MPYTSYRAYVVQNNLAFIFSIIVVNHLATVFNIRPLLFLLNWFYFKLAECSLIFACCYNVYTATSDIFTPYISSIHVPYHDYLFVPGPITTVLYKLYSCLFRGQNKESAPAPAPSGPAKSTDESKFNSIYSKFFGTHTTYKPFIIDGKSISSNATETVNTAATNNDSNINNAASALHTQKRIINPQTSLGINLLNTSSLTASRATYNYGNTIPKLKYAPCIHLPLEPSEYRPRLLWFLHPTPEVVEDFRIEQVIAFKKYWHKFSDRFSRNYYEEKLTTALLKHIFTPLANSIDTFNSKLAPNRNIAICSSEIVALSYLMPEISGDSHFKLHEVMKLLTLENYTSTSCIKYISQRVTELATSKMKAFRITPVIEGMPTDSDIIMQIFKKYLELKEPHAIPPLIPNEIDIFKFLIIYFYITPELDKWGIFKNY